jgi:hypothetical protein
MKKYSILSIDGGIGKSIMATAVCENIKLQHPEHELLVITAYPEVFIGNPNVYKVFRSGNFPYFYEDYVKNSEDTLFFLEEPYRSKGYLQQDKHLIESWCETIGVEVKTTKPSLHYNPLELEQVESLIQTDKPVLLFQPFGGDVNKQRMPEDLNYCWNRDIPPHQAQIAVDILKKEYYVVHVKGQGQPSLRGCQEITLAPRNLLALPKFVDRIIGIDSCIQHAAAAWEKAATVCWVTNKPKVFGYDLHKNILPQEGIKTDVSNIFIDGLLQEFDFGGGRTHDFPFLTKDVFDIQDIIK